MKTTRRKALALAATAPVALALPAFASAFRVDIQGRAFHPAELQIHPGDTVQFTNTGGGTHTASALDGSFDTGTLKQDQSGEVTFSKAGSFDYRCRFHHSMKGTITVS